MAPDRRSDLDRKLATVIGHLLRAGVLTAAAIVLAGGVLYLVQNAAVPADYHTFREPSAHLRSVRGIFQSALAGDSYAIIQLGLLVLMATPVLRVIFSVVAFALERDILYVVATLIVLGVLLFSLFARSV